MERKYQVTAMSQQEMQGILGAIARKHYADIMKVNVDNVTFLQAQTEAITALSNLFSANRALFMGGTQ